MIVIMIRVRALILFLLLSTCIALSSHVKETAPRVFKLLGRQDDTQEDDDGPIPLEEMYVISLLKFRLPPYFQFKQID